MSYLDFKHSGFSPSGKTMIWNIYAINSDTLLGTIKWYAPWRKYCFYPYNWTIFDSNCLTEIKDKIDLLMRTRDSYELSQKD